MKPYFYVVVPIDVPQLNPGKLAAQACHAQSMMCETLKGSDLYGAWSENRGFGTVIILYTRETMQDAHDKVYAAKKADIMKRTIVSRDGINTANTVFQVKDPTYPMVNVLGDSYTIEQKTCFGVLLDVDDPKNEETLAILKSYKLYP